MPTVGDILAFAAANPDYWSILVPGHDVEPREILELDDSRRRAFDAARAEVRAKVASIMLAVHDALKSAAKAGEGSPIAEPLEQGMNTPSLNKGEKKWKIVEGRGKLSWLSVRFALNSAGTAQQVTVELETAKARAETLVDAVAEASHHDCKIDGSTATASMPLNDAEADIDSLASTLVHKIWPVVEVFVAKLSDKDDLETHEDESSN